jgi:hypothetical protein
VVGAAILVASVVTLNFLKNRNIVEVPREYLRPSAEPAG